MPVDVDRQKLHAAIQRELDRFRQTHPRSYDLSQRAQQSLLAGVPMSWMVRWAGDFPLFVADADGAHFTDVDGHKYLDFCLGDTGAMTGHAPSPTVRAIQEQARRGITFMLPIEEALWVGEELGRRFGLPYWQFTLTATDANRFVIRLARHITRRPKILVFSWCYHGTVDETFIVLENGQPCPRPGNMGPPVHPSETTRVVEFNDLEALERELAQGDVACVLTEPVMTNIGIIHPMEGFHAALRDLTRRYGTLLVLDETHTICAGIGGYTREHGLEPDFITLGKPIGGGVPAATYGLSAEVAERVRAMSERNTADTGGIGGTLAGNALSIAAMRATLEQVLTEEAFAKTLPLAQQWTEGVQAAIDASGLPWHVTRLGCRAEYWFCPRHPRNGGEAAAAIDHDLDHYMHLGALNRGILMTPFHNMALIAPVTTPADIDYHSQVFRDLVAAIL